MYWRPLEGWRPLLRGILDPPLIMFIIFPKKLHGIEKRDQGRAILAPRLDSLGAQGLFFAEALILHSG